MKIDIDINEMYQELKVLVQAPEMTTEVANLIANLKVKKEETFVGIKDEKMYVLRPKDIVLFYTENQKVMADTMEASYEINSKLYQIEEALVDHAFARISKSVIANVHHIKNIEIYFNGSLLTVFDNGRKEIISRRYVAKVKEFLGMGGK